MKKALINCFIIDGTEKPTVEDGAVIVDNGRIAAVGPGKTVLDDEKGFEGEVLNMKGWALLPGLMDSHFHLSSVPPWKETYKIKQSPIPMITIASAKRAMAHLRAGVTSMRVIGEIGHIDISLREVFDTGMLLGPRLFVAGEGITCTGGHGHKAGGFLEADGPDAFRKVAREQLKAGADFIKIIATGGIGTKAGGIWSVQLSPEEIRAAADVVHQAGKYLAAHATGPLGVMTCVENGVDCIEHGFALDEPAIACMAENKTVLSPTLTVTWAWNEDFLRKNNYETWVIEKAKAASESHPRGFRQAVEAGVMVVSGTDELTADYYDGAVALVKDIELMSRNGLSNLQAIQAATINGAKLSRVDGDLGTVEQGKWADLIAVEGNPLEDITSLRNLRFVMKGGKVVPLSDDVEVSGLS